MTARKVILNVCDQHWGNIQKVTVTYVTHDLLFVVSLPEKKHKWWLLVIIKDIGGSYVTNEAIRLPGQILNL